MKKLVVTKLWAFERDLRQVPVTANNWNTDYLTADAAELVTAVWVWTTDNTNIRVHELVDGRFHVEVTEYRGPNTMTGMVRTLSAVVRSGQRLNLGHLGVLELVAEVQDVEIGLPDNLFVVPNSD